MNNYSNVLNKTLFYLMCAMFLSVLISTYLIFFANKNYAFIVELPCDSGETSCFVRQCDVEGECPPNELEQYRMFSVNAADFEQCTDNSCVPKCTEGLIECEEILCDESIGDVCTPYSPEEIMVDDSNAQEEISDIQE